MKLNERQKKFADYYIESGNATEAAIKAGYSERTARAIASENLTKPYIAEYVKVRLDRLEAKRIADMTEVQQFWAETMRNDKNARKDRIKASELIAKTNGAFLDRVEHSGGLNVTHNPLEEMSTEEIKAMVDKLG